MTVEGAARTIRLKDGVDTKHNARDIAPISVVCFGIEETHIGDGVLLVVQRELGRAGRQICDRVVGRHYLKILPTEKS